VLIALYRVFLQILNNGSIETLIGEINQILYSPVLKLTSFDLTFFGIDLGMYPSQWQQHGVWLLSVPLITAGLQWVQTRTMMANQSTQKPVKKVEKKSSKKKEEKKEDSLGDIQKQMALITPIMFGFFAFQFPLGLALYWNVFGLFGIIQQKLINRQI
jgi:membrane protein insertase Oxa1/YidC/SpoIIIJ